MEYLGTKVGTGVGIGKVLIINEKIPEIKELKLTDPNDLKDELKKLEDSLNATLDDYNKIIEEVKTGEIKELCDFYKMLISSPTLQAELRELIEKQSYSAYGSIKTIFEKKELELSQLDNAYLRERSKDVEDVTNKILKKLFNIKEIDLKSLKEDTILVSDEISPSILLSNNLEHIKGIVSEVGGKTSHVAILANNLGIPAVFGIKHISTILENGSTVFVDGNKGIVQDHLYSSDIEKINKLIEKEKLLQEELKNMIGKKAITLDNKEYLVYANTGDLSEIAKLDELQVDGIGLFRTEFLFLNKVTAPTEEYLFNIYKNFAEKIDKKTLIIRTLDIGGDKKCNYIDIPKEENPFLGYRAIRYCLENKEFFKTSLKAILRASYYGHIEIMYPMISSLDEVFKANEILDMAKQELAKENIPFDKNIKVGVMIEIPSAALNAENIIKNVDFFSIGTNDLTQYTLAVDRGNPNVSKLYNYFNPGVIKLIKMSIDAGNKNNKMVGMCGEMAADPLGIILLVGLDLKEFSVNIGSLLKVKKFITMLDFNKCKDIAEEVLTMSDAGRIEEYLKTKAQEFYGKYY